MKNDQELQGTIILSISGLLFVVTIIASAMFSEKIPYGDYIFSAALISELILMFIGIRKTMQGIISKR